MPALFVQDPDTLAERPANLEAVEARQSRIQTMERSLADNQVAATQLGRLASYRDVMTTFGEYNEQENFQVQYEAGSIPLLKKMGAEKAKYKYDNSEGKKAGLTDESKEHVAQTLNIEDLTEKGILSSSQANAIVEATHDNYAGRFRGLENKQDRKNEKAKIDRRIVKTENSLK